MRGHQVTLLEQGKQLGSPLLMPPRPRRDAFEQCISRKRDDPLGVDVRLGATADIAAIKALSPEAVVIATGALPRVPHDVTGLELPHVVQGWEVMKGKIPAGKRIALISQEDYYETPCIAEFLAERGKEVEVFHKSVHLGTEIARSRDGSCPLEQCGVLVHRT
jgi:hypothetical protein